MMVNVRFQSGAHVSQVLIDSVGAGAETCVVVVFLFFVAIGDDCMFHRGEIMSRKRTDPGKKERKLQKKLEKKYLKLEKKLRALEMKLRELGGKAGSKTKGKAGKRSRKKEERASQPYRSESGSPPISPNVVTLPSDQ